MTRKQMERRGLVSFLTNWPNRGLQFPQRNTHYCKYTQQTNNSRGREGKREIQMILHLITNRTDHHHGTRTDQRNTDTLACIRSARAQPSLAPAEQETQTGLWNTIYCKPFDNWLREICSSVLSLYSLSSCIFSYISQNSNLIGT